MTSPVAAGVAVDDKFAAAATPFLLVDGRACETNIRIAAEFFSARAVKLRPHFKAHKCTALLRRQISAGGCSGVTCATGWEAAHLARAGIEEILVANEVIDAWELRAAASAAQRTRVTIAADDVAHVRALIDAARESGVRFGVLIDINVGTGRGGLDPDDPALEPIARSIAASAELELLGLMGYEGHVVLEPDRGVRSRLVAEAAQSLVHARARLAAWGLACPVVSGGGTGTYDLSAEAGIWTEIQAGSYALMDATYAKLALPFTPALYCVATVSSRHGHRATLNAGLKSMSAEYGMPTPSREGISVLGLSDEHCRLAIEDSETLSVGERVCLIPAHVDPTVNLHDVLYVDHGGPTLDRWKIDGRTRGTAAA